jgi:hypothetical protein
LKRRNFNNSPIVCSSYLYFLCFQLGNKNFARFFRINLKPLYVAIHRMQYGGRNVSLHNYTNFIALGNIATCPDFYTCHCIKMIIIKSRNTLKLELQKPKFTEITYNSYTKIRQRNWLIENIAIYLFMRTYITTR